MLTADLRLRAAFAYHRVQPGPNMGYFVCLCGCGFVGVCRHCVPTAPATLPSLLCDEAKKLVQLGRACCTKEGGVDVVTDAC